MKCGYCDSCAIIMTSTLKLMQERRSVRVPFDPDHPIADEDLKQILEAARWAPSPHNMQNFEILVIDDQDILTKLGSIESCVTEDFLRENYEQLSFSKKELLRKKVGILGTEFPASFRDPSMFSKVARECPPMPLNQTIDGSPVVIIVIYDSRKRAPDSEGDILGLVSLGCVMENMWLMAQSLGISVRIMSDFGDKVVDRAVKRVLHIPDHMNVVYGLRLGYPTTSLAKNLSVRREVKDFTHHNDYDGKGIE